MTTTHCRRAFDQGQASRRKHPLTRGAYKLRETQQNLNRMIATLDAVGDYSATPSPAPWAFAPRGLYHRR